MSKALTIDVREYPGLARFAQGSKTVCVRAAESVDLSGAYWDGGSRSRYAGFDGQPAPRSVALPRHGGAPQFGGTSARVALAPAGADPSALAYVVEFWIFRGKHMAPDVTMHPTRFEALEREVNARNPRPELTPAQWAALRVTARLISSARKAEFGREFPPSQYQPARDALAALGLLTKTGAITAAGRNALRD